MMLRTFIIKNKLNGLKKHWS